MNLDSVNHEDPLPCRASKWSENREGLTFVFVLLQPPPLPPFCRIVLTTHWLHQQLQNSPGETNDLLAGVPQPGRASRGKYHVNSGRSRTPGLRTLQSVATPNETNHDPGTPRTTSEKIPVAVRFLFSIMRPWLLPVGKKRFSTSSSRSCPATATLRRLRRLRAAWASRAWPPCTSTSPTSKRRACLTACTTAAGRSTCCRPARAPAPATAFRSPAASPPACPSKPPSRRKAFRSTTWSAT